MKPLEIIIIVMAVAGIVILQIYLSRKENKWLGLILPLIALCFAIFAAFVTPLYMISSGETISEQTVTENGKVIESIITHVPQQTAPDAVSLILTGISIFAFYNIPTAILLLIYAACRVKKKKNDELKKMNIQDL